MNDIFQNNKKSSDLIKLNVNLIKNTCNFSLVLRSPLKTKILLIIVKITKN